MPRYQFDVTLDPTTGESGSFVVDVKPEWAPLGAARFDELVSSGFYPGVKFFRTIPGFVTQFGLHPLPAVSAKWRDARIADDPVTQTNSPGRVVFATSGPNSRTSQVFINLGDNARLDGMGFAPFGEVVEGFDVVQKIYGGYGGDRIDQGQVREHGDAYLKDFPKLSVIQSVKKQ